MPLNAQIALSIVAHESSAGDLSKTLRVTPASYAVSLTDGTGANQAQVAWSDSRTATDCFGGGDSLDLQSLSDDRGTVVFTSIKAMYFRNTGSTTIEWNDAGANSWSSFLGQPADSQIYFPPGVAMLLVAPSADGFPVTSSFRTVRFCVRGAGSSTYEIALIGEGTIT